MNKSLALSLSLLLAGVGCALALDDDDDLYLDDDLLDDDADYEGAPFDSTANLITIGSKPTTKNTVLEEAIPIGAGRLPRWHHVACDWTCSKWWVENDYGSGTSLRHCLEWQESCDHRAERAGMYGNATELAEWQPFWARSLGDGDHYAGCGPHAIENLLKFYGYYGKTAKDIRAEVKTYKIGKNIATLPTDLRTGLAKLLNAHAEGTFSVTRLSGQHPTKIRSELSKGNLAVALVNNGGHYVIITGFRKIGENAYVYHVIDYLGHDRWVYEPEINLGFGLFPSWGSLASSILHKGKYHPGTVLVVERTSYGACTEGETRTVSCPDGQFGTGRVERCSLGRWVLVSSDCFQLGGIFF